MEREGKEGKISKYKIEAIKTKNNSKRKKTESRCNIKNERTTRKERRRIELEDGQ